MKIFGSFNMSKQDAHDKSIRQKLDELNVEPPAGLWDRIEAELPPEGARVLPIGNVLFQTSENERMRNTLNAHEVEPPSFVWDRIEEQLPQERKRRFGAAWYAVPMAASIIGLAVYLGVQPQPETNGRENTGALADSHSAEKLNGARQQSNGQAQQTQAAVPNVPFAEGKTQHAERTAQNADRDSKNAVRHTQDAVHNTQSAGHLIQGTGQTASAAERNTQSSANHAQIAGRNSFSTGRRTQDVRSNSFDAGRSNNLPPTGPASALSGGMNGQTADNQGNNSGLAASQSVSRVGIDQLALIPNEAAKLPEKWRKKTLALTGREKPALKQNGSDPLRNPATARWSIGLIAMGGSVSTQIVSHDPQGIAYAAENNATYTTVDFAPGSMSGGAIAARFNISKRLSATAALGMQRQTIIRPIRQSPYHMNETPNPDVIQLLADYAKMGNNMVGVGDFNQLQKDYQACAQNYNNTALETRLTYFNIPVSFRYTQPFKRFNLFAEGGMAFQLLGRSRNFMDKAVPGTEASGRNVRLPGENSEFKSFNSALNLQTGLSVALGKRMRMDLAPGVQFSLNSLNNSEPQMYTMGSYLNCGLFYSL